MMTEYFNIGFYLVTIWAITNETNLCHVWSGAPIRAASYSHHYRLLILDANLLSRQHYLNYQVTRQVQNAQHIIKSETEF
jgi:hypothetical protein